MTSNDYYGTTDQVNNAVRMATTLTDDEKFLAWAKNWLNGKGLRNESKKMWIHARAVRCNQRVIMAVEAAWALAESWAAHGYETTCRLGELAKKLALSMTTSDDKQNITADWDSEKYIACFGVMTWVSEDGDEWRDSRTGKFPSSPEFQNCSITLIGGPRDGETVA